MLNVFIGLLFLVIVMIIIVLGIFINDSIKSYQEKTKYKKQVELADKLNSVCNDGFEEIKKEVKEMFNKDFVVKKWKDESKIINDFLPQSFNESLDEYKKVENASLYGVPKDNKMCIRVKGFIIRLDVDKAMRTLERINCFKTKIEEYENKIKNIIPELDDNLKPIVVRAFVENNQDIMKYFIELKNEYTKRLIGLKKELSDYEHDVIEEFRKDDM